MKSTVNKIILFYSLIFFLLTIYFSRQIFFYRYEPEYYENFYYHSQWNIPQSTRGISDSELYKFVGYQLVNGENPFNINFEVPPIGKYLYGLGEKLFSNPYYINIFYYFGIALSVYLIVLSITNNKTLSLLSLLLFATTPFVATQIKQTMLDLPLAFFFSTYFLFFIKYLKKGKQKYLITAGIFLGLATGTKIAVYTIPILLFNIIFLLKYSKFKTKHIILLIASTFTGYVLAYFCYFIKHPNPIPWIRLHQKPFDFYIKPFITRGKPEIDHLNQLTTIFLNNYKGWWQTNERKMAGDWSVILPIGFLSSLAFIFKPDKHKKIIFIYITTIIFLIVNTIIPFSPRHLMPLIPLFIVLIIYTFKKIPIIIITIILFSIPSYFLNLNPKNINNAPREISRFFSTRAYRELYRNIDPDQLKNLPEDIFISNIDNFLDQLGTRSIDIDISKINQNKNTAQITYDITYQTKYGPISHQKIFNFKKINHQWKLVWNWQYLWSNYQANMPITIEASQIPLLGIKDKSGQILAQRSNWYEIYNIPRLMFDWSQSVTKLANLTNQNYSETDQIIKNNIPDDFFRYVGYLNPHQSELQQNIITAKQIPGVSLEEISYLSIPDSLPIETQNSTAKLINQIQDTSPNLFFVPANIYFFKGNQKIPILESQNIPETYIRQDIN